MELNNLTKEEILNGCIEGNITECDSIIIIPTEDEHNSGYSYFDFICINNGQKNIYKSTDIISLNNFIEKTNFNFGIDVLHKSKLIRIFNNLGKLKKNIFYIFSN